MKKNLLLFSLLMLLLLPSFTAAVDPTYEVKILNQIAVAPNQIEYDIYVKRTGATPMEAYGLQHSFIFNNAFLNGGTPTVTYVAGTSEMVAAQEPTNTINATSVVGGMRVIKMAAKIPPGPGSGTVISSTGDGTRFGRFRLVTSATNFTDPSGFVWNFNQATYGYATKYNAYVDDGGGPLPKDITVQGSHLQPPPPLPVELSSFTAAPQLRDVVLNWETKTETNTSSFVVERSLVKNSVKTFAVVGEIPASGNSNSPKSYSYTDQKLQSGNYVYRLKMIDNDGTFEYSKEVESEVALPKDYAISQNYPNPFNPSTRVDYQLPFDSKVTIDLYGITGEKIATLINSELAAGYYTANINASALNLASGVYIYRISASNQTAQNFVQVKKMMLTK